MFRRHALQLEIAFAQLQSGNNELNWNFRSDLRQEQAFEVTSVRESILRSGLFYNADSGLSASISLAGYKAEISSLLLDSRQMSYGVRVAQEVLQMNGRSAEALSRKAVAIAAYKIPVTIKAEDLAGRLDLVKYVETRFERYCRILDITDLIQKVDKLEKIASAQHQARSINSRDLVRFQALKSNLASKLSILRGELSALQTSDTVRGEGFQEHMSGLESRFDCQSAFEALPALDSPDIETIIEALGSHPDVLALEVELRILRNTTEIIRAKQSPKLEVFGGLEQTRYSGNTGQQSAYNVGLALSWPLDSDVSAGELKLSSKQKILIDFEKTQTLSMLRGQIQVLEDLRSSQAANFQSLRRYQADLQKLLSIIDTQQDLGMLDATSAISAISDLLAATQEVRKSWLQFFVSNASLSLIAKALNFRTAADKTPKTSRNKEMTTE